MKYFFLRISRALLLTSAIICGLTLPIVATEKRTITETDLFKFAWIADAQISPDGLFVAYLRVTVNQKADRYDTALWIVPTMGGTARQLTAGARDAMPRWSPDSKSIAFLRIAERDNKPQAPQIYLLSLAGGEAQPITDLQRGAGAFEWSPNGKIIAFSSSVEINKKEKSDEHVSDVRVITKAVYRANGGGYNDNTARSQIFTIALPSNDEKPTPKQITKGVFSASNFHWSPDGTRIYFVSNRVAESYYEQPHTDLFSVALDGNDEKNILSFDGSLGDYEFSHDGKKIAFGGTISTKPAVSYQQPDLFICDNREGATAKNLTANYDFDIGGGIGGDQHSPRGGNPNSVIWSNDDRALFVNVAEHGRADLKKIDIASGKVEAITKGDHEVISFSPSSNNAKMALVISDSINIGDIFVLDSASGKLTQLTKNNDELFSQLNLTHPEEIWYTSFDGKKIQGWIQKPPNFDPSKKYPLILEIHGGPHTAYGFTFTHEFQWMAAKGYVVLYKTRAVALRMGRNLATSFNTITPAMITKI